MFQKLRRHARPDLLIDEFGCDLMERQESPQAAHLLYQIIDLQPKKIYRTRCQCGF
jgi:hypothetical protein